MYAPLTALFLSFITAYFFIPVIIRIASVKRLYDEPDERKVHTRPISSLGGVGVFAGFIFALLLSSPFMQAAELQYYATASLVIFFLGLKDDLMVIRPLPKLIGQLIAAGILIHLGGVRLEGMFGFMGIDAIPQWFGCAVSYFLIVLIINACNLIDGIDGLAGSLGLTITAMLGSYFLYIGQAPYAILAFAVTGSLAAFLFYNMQPARIFMGDGGSMLLGMVVAVLIIRFINVAPFSKAMPLHASPAIAFGILVVPLMDTLRVFAIRMLQGRSPFSPDKNHVHHLLLRRHWSHRRIALALTAVNTCFVLIALFGASLDVNLLFFIIAALFFSGMGLITRPISGTKAKRKIGEGTAAPMPQPHTTIIPANSSVLTENN